MENVIITKFKVESEAFQAFSNLKADPVNDSCVISQTALIKREKGNFMVVDHFDTLASTGDEALKGGLIGLLLGIFTGPLGMLYFGSLGLLGGSVIDAGNVAGEASLVEHVLENVKKDGIYLITTAQENGEGMYDSKVSAFDHTTIRYRAALVAAEIEHAREVERGLRKIARKEVREKKTKEYKAKTSEADEKIKAKFNVIVSKFKNKI